MTGLEPHVQRVVKVRGTLLGSGYAVGVDLVLTAGHVVGARGEAAWLSRSDSPTTAEQRATVIWRGDGIGADAALLRLDVPLWTVEETHTRYGELRGHQPVPCLTVGYPWVQVSRDGRRRLDELPGHVMPSLGFEDHRYALDSTRIAPNPPQPRRDATGAVVLDEAGAPVWDPHPHSGYSGAPLLTAGERQLLVGVVLAVPSRYGPGRLDAVRISQLLTDPTFAGLLGTSLDQLERVPAQLLPTGVVEHDEALTGLADHLRGDLLPYVPPADAGAATHPGRLLERLDELAGTCGLLLVGQAGIGKTRTCFEVANCAVDAGWRVLHVRPGEPLVTTEQLLDVVTGATDERLLIIVDYLNLSGLDYPAIRHRLLPAARARGIRLALLGSARPGWFHQKDNTPLTEVFKPVELRPEDEHLDRIRHQIVTALAPTARTILGEGRLAHLCGRRPVIATLIAAEAEAQAVRGRLSAATGDLRPEYLLDWLVRRLNEDDLLHQAARLDDERDPDLRLQIYAAMAAATPQPRPALIACGGRVAGNDDARAEHLLDVLLAMGWMITTADGLAPVHDIVVDQLLEHCAVRAGLNTVRTTAANRILDASLTSARTIGRYAMNFARLLRDLALQQRDGPLAAHNTAWLRGNATAAGGLLSSQQDEGAYALGAVLDNPPWAQALFQHWPQLGAPWLSTHGASLPARHILYKGLRTVATAQASQLIDVATAWLGLHQTALEASFVIAPLLGRADLKPEDATRGIDASLRWLDRHGDLTEASFVLYQLLGRNDLTPEHLHQAVPAALRWLDRHGDLTEAGFVLPPLLGRNDLTPEHLHQAILPALRWLDRHGDLARAGFVLPPLLGRNDLTPEHLHQVLPPTLRWLQHHNDLATAQFVLYSLLTRTDLPAEAARTAITAAQHWLGHHGDLVEAQFVLKALLGRTDLPAETAQTAITAAHHWLGHHGGLLDAGFVLHPLLSRTDLPAEAALTAITAGQHWLGQYHDLVDAQFVLKALLGRTDLPAEAALTTATAAQHWLGHHGDLAAAQFMLKALLGRTDLPAETARTTITAAQHWLGHHGDLVEAQFVVKALLGRTDLPAETAQTAITAAHHWLGRHGGLLDAGFVLPSLLARADLSAESLNRGIEAALDWLQTYGDTDDAGYVLPRLLAVRRLAELPEWLPALVDRWADRHRSGTEIVFVSKHLARQNALTETTADVLLQWAADHPYDADVPWRVVGVATAIDRFPALAGRLLRSIENYLDGIEQEPTKPNQHGEVDSLIQSVCRPRTLCCGLAGARVDDIVLRWLTHPAALNPRCPEGIQFKETVSRACALVRAGRLSHQGAVGLLSRLHAWIPRWRPTERQLPLREKARENVAALLAYLRQSTEPAPPEAPAPSSRQPAVPVQAAPDSGGGTLPADIASGHAPSGPPRRPDPGRP
ncbi:hypothetical protein QQG74_22135 [Micromonospora sp. FIMYZ51]|uniref:hypothetical protein n=1 Tax=Micromonospora sp. FIMYZ51 TaxID=3051832 RepID=UPI00311E4B11